MLITVKQTEQSLWKRAYFSQRISTINTKKQFKILYFRKNTIKLLIISDSFESNFPPLHK